MNRSNGLDNGPSNLPSLRHPTAWELSGHRRRPYTTTGLTPRAVKSDDLGRAHYQHQTHYHRHHVGPTTRDELLYPRGDHRQQMLEMEDLLQRYREELERKDQEILHLTSIDTPRAPGKVDHQYGVDYTPPGSDFAALQIRVTTLESKLFEAQREIDAREQTVRDLQASIDVRMEVDARHEALIQSLRQKLAEYESAYGNIEGAANRSELTIVTLQQQNNDAQQRIVELESRLRTLSDERNGADQRALNVELKLSEVLNQINDILMVDSVSTVTHDRTLSAVRDLVHENSMLRGKVSNISDQTRNHDAELQTNRETINRLNAQIDRLNKSTSTTTIDMENIRLERDASVLKLREAEREIELLKDRLEASQIGWSDARRQLEERVSHSDNHHGGYHGVGIEAAHAFLETLSHLLSDSRNFVEPNEDRIKERVRDLVHAVRDKNARLEALERKLADFELERDAHIGSDDRHHKRLQPGIEQLEERLRRAELELVASDRLKDALHAEEAKMMRFLNDVSRMLRIESATLEISAEGAIEAVLRRLEQITRNDSTSRSPGEHSDCHLHIHGLQRKVKNLKEKLNSKEVENDLLRKKVSSLEDRLSATERNDRDREEEFSKNRRLVKLVEKYKFELNEAHTEIRELKTRLSHCSEIQVAATEKERELERLERQVGQLEHVREQQAMKITDLQDEANAHSRQFDRHDEAVATRVAILSDEVRTLRQALEETSRRERQLQDLRRVIARMLAIDVIHVPVPDYEIISRLEKLILAQQTNSTIASVTSALSLDDIIDEMGDEFRSGYQNAGYVLAPRRQRAHSPVRSSSHHRAKSPAKKLDAKVY